VGLCPSINLQLATYTTFPKGLYSVKYKLSDLLPIITETLSGGREFTLSVTGTSMLPLLIEKRDSVSIKQPEFPLKKGDLPLYRRADGSFVLHRVVGFDDGGYIMSGDNQIIAEHGISQDMIIGVVSKIERNGRHISVKSPLYRLYVSLWTALFKVRYPLRRLRKSAKNTDEQAKSPILKPKPCVTYLISLIRCAINGDEPPSVPEDVDLKDVFKLALAHKVANIAAYSVIELENISPEIKNAFKTELFKVVQRRASQEEQLKKIEESLQAQGIKYCVLKGNEIAKYYTFPDMRFSLDIDIYVEPKEVPRAEEIMQGLGYVQEGQKNTKDVAFTKKPNLTVEIHFDLNFETDLTHDYFAELLRRLKPVDGNDCKFRMTDEDLFIYTLGHTAHHFLVAGTGIRSIIDDYILREKLLPSCDADYVNNQLRSAGLLSFSERISELGDYWFKNGTQSDIVNGLEKYVIESGVFGTESFFFENSAVPQSTMGGSRAGYVLERIFPSYILMTALFPVLRRMPVLLPFFWFVRWFKILKNTRRISGEIAKIASVDEEKVKDRSALFKNMGFK